MAIPCKVGKQVPDLEHHPRSGSHFPYKVPRPKSHLVQKCSSVAQVQLPDHLSNRIIFTCRPSPRYRWLRVLICPVSLKPHFSITLPEAGLSTRQSPQSIRNPFTLKQSVGPSYPIPYLGILLTYRDIALTMRIIANAADSFASLFQLKRPSMPIGKDIPNDRTALFQGLMRRPSRPDANLRF